MSVEHSLDFEKLQRDPVSRRAFLQRMGAAGLGLAAANLLQGCGGGGGGNNNRNNFPGIPGQSNDVRALNYALSLETLEADLYRQALNVASGRPQNPNPQEERLDAFSSYTQQVPSGTFPGPGAPQETRGQVGFLYLQQFAFVEAAHRDFLRVAISSNGGTPITRAQLAPRGFKFPTGTTLRDIQEILAAILPLEETGVRAYLGAVPLIENPGFLQIAGTIYSTECRHSAAVRYLFNENEIGPSKQFGTTTFGGQEVPGTSVPASASAVADQLFEKFLTPQTVLNAIKPMIA